MSNDNVIYVDFTKADAPGNEQYFAIHSEDGIMHFLGDFEGGDEGFTAAGVAAADLGIEPMVIITGGIANQWERCIIENLLLGFAG
jgi:hypothetical protein|tara:strand:+ start:477 stop:734 length:258 start_codon:yes stop_codon:yes gene_type:complete